MKRAIPALAVLLCCVTVTWAQPAGATPTTPGSSYTVRERALKIPEIITALGLKDGSVMADIGAGDGDYEVLLSRAVGSAGRVYAEDIRESAVKELHKVVTNNRLDNVTVLQGDPDDPKLPSGALDAVLMVITYHEVVPYQKMLERVMTTLKPGGRFVVVDMMPYKTLTRPRADQTKNHRIASGLAESEIRSAGFEVVSRDDRFIDEPDEESTRWMIVSRKPGSPL
jgi:ubiquinone/menaquinone biosynthesis C-methylase UbiE